MLRHLWRKWFGHVVTRVARNNGLEKWYCHRCGCHLAHRTGDSMNRFLQWDADFEDAIRM